MKQPMLNEKEAAVVLKLLYGDASAEETEQIDCLLRTQPGRARDLVNLIGQDAWLNWHSTPDRLPNANDPVRSMGGPGDGRRKPRTTAAWPRLPLVLAASIAIVAFTLGAYFSHAIWRSGQPARSDRAGGDVVMQAPKSPKRLYSARVMETTACRWQPGEGVALAADAPLRQGDSINLLEGIAKLRLSQGDSEADLSLEGPAGLVLNTSGGCNLTQGQMWACVESNPGGFSVDVPNCQLSVADHRCVFGVSVDGSTCEVHVFEGVLNVAFQWRDDQFTSQSASVVAGESLTIGRDDTGRIDFTRGFSNEGLYASRTSMQADSLAIPADYVEMVRDADPLLYWRFEERGDDGSFPNVVSDIHRCSVAGRLEHERQQDNGFVRFTGATSADELQAHLFSDTETDFGGSDSYSVELWLKPSHYHTGTVVAMYVPVENFYHKKHGMLLEVIGPMVSRGSVVDPCTVRFLHRSPPGLDPNSPSSCYSTVRYRLRQWQHVVAVKRPEVQELYLDGALVASVADVNAPSNGTRLVVGQIDDQRTIRRFVGQVDELSVYTHALSAESILARYKTVREASPKRRVRRPVDSF